MSYSSCIRHTKYYIIRFMFIRKISKITTSVHRTNILQPSYFFSQMQKMNPEKDYYRILDVPRDADSDQVLAAYDKLKYLYDPSVNPANREKFNEIEQAKLVLANEKSRKQYDKERFYIKFTNEMKTRYEKQGDEPFQTQKTDRYSFDLTPEQDEVFQKTKKFIKKVLIVAVGVALFFPFFLWKGGDQNPAVSETGGYAMRPSSYHRAEVARMQQEQQQMHQAYQQQYPGSTVPGSYPPQQVYQQNPNMIVTGQFVTD